MKSQGKPQIAIYSRKSKFTGRGESIENQIGLCRQYIQLQDGGGAEDCLIYEDEGFSGGNLERPQFKRMLADGRAGRISAIIVYRLDRISRNIGDFAGLIETLNELGISFLSIKEQFDTRSPMGRAMMYIASVFSQLERETIAERIRDNMQELAKTGRWLGGVTPTGYGTENITKVTIDGKIKKSCKLNLRQEEAETVRMIFYRFLESGSLADTENYLKEQGQRTKKGNVFSRFAIRDILSNPVYMAADEAAYGYFFEKGAEVFCPDTLFDGRFGIMAYNRTLQRRGKANRQRELSEWIIAVGAHEPLLSGREWVRVQKLLESNKRPGGKRTKENSSALSGLLFCGACGACMRPKLSGREAPDTPAGERRFSYLCTGKEKSLGRLCSMENISGIRLDDEVAGELGCLLEDEKIFIKKLERFSQSLSKSKENPDAGRHLCEEQLEETHSEIKNLVQILATVKDGIPAPYIVEQIEELHRKVNKLTLRLQKIEEAAAAEWLSEEELEDLCAGLSSFDRIFASLCREQRKILLRELVKRVDWDGKTAHIYVCESQDSIDNK